MVKSETTLCARFLSISPILMQQRFLIMPVSIPISDNILSLRFANQSVANK